MNYCEDCRAKHRWPWTCRGEGHCDLCGIEGTCYRIDADALRVRNRVTLTTALDWAERIAKRIADRRPEDVVETHLIMAHTIMEVQIEALALSRNPDFLTSIYELESMDELRLKVCKMHEQLEHAHQRIEALKHAHRVDNLGRAEGHCRAAWVLVGLMRSIANFIRLQDDDASVRFSLLELA